MTDEKTNATQPEKRQARVESGVLTYRDVTAPGRLAKNVGHACLESNLSVSHKTAAKAAHRVFSQAVKLTFSEDADNSAALLVIQKRFHFVSKDQAARFVFRVGLGALEVVGKEIAL